MTNLKLKTHEGLELKYVSYNPENLTLRAFVITDPEQKLTGTIIEAEFSKFRNVDAYVHWFFPECPVEHILNMTPKERLEFCVHRRSEIIRDKVKAMAERTVKRKASPKARKSKDEKVAEKLAKMSPKLRERYLKLQELGDDISKLLR